MGLAQSLWTHQFILHSLIRLFVSQTFPRPNPEDADELSPGVRFVRRSPSKGEISPKSTLPKRESQKHEGNDDVRVIGRDVSFACRSFDSIRPNCGGFLRQVGDDVNFPTDDGAAALDDDGRNYPSRKSSSSSIYANQYDGETERG